ncbi:MAG: Calx-beta domain-containing protein, partial [Crocosphaera sp.]
MNNNQSYIEFSSANYSGIEKDQPFPNQIEVTVTRSQNIENFNSVELHLRRGKTTAQEGIDFDGMFLQSIDFETGQTEKKVYIDIYDDFELEGTEKIELKLIGDPAILGQQDTTTVSIFDNETTYVEFASSNYVIMEQEDPFINPLEVTVTRSGNTNGYTSAMLEVVSGSAEEWNDFSIPNIFVDFMDGETEKTILIEVPNDGFLEGTESFELKLIDDPYNPEITLGENASTTIDILDKETTYLEFASSKYVTMEQEDSIMNPLEVTVTRSGNTDSSITAMLEVVSGSAE